MAAKQQETLCFFERLEKDLIELQENELKRSQ